MLPTRHRPAVLTSTLLLAAGVAVAAPAVRPVPSPLALSCQGCHQPARNAATMPALDRYPPAAIAASLREARDQPQAGSIMARFAQHLSDAEIDALAVELGTPAKP